MKSHVEKGADMNKKERMMSQEDCWTCFDQSPYSTLSMVKDQKPYAVPLSCARIDDVVYFHCAKQGLKSDLINTNKHVWLSSVSYVENNDTYPTTYYRSVMMEGECYVVEDENEAYTALEAITKRYSSTYTFKSDSSCMRAVMVCGIRIQQVYGKKNEMPTK